MSFRGIFAIDDTLTWYVNTHTPSTGAAVDADAVPGYRIYEDETATPLLTGSLALLDDGNTVGFYSEQVTLSAANGFELGKSYCIRTTLVVGAVTGVDLQTFQMGAKVDVLRWNGTAVSTPATAGIPDVNVKNIDNDAASAAGTVTFPNATLASTTNITAGTITTATNVTTVNGLAAGVITAASLAADAITDAKVAADVTIASVTGAVGSVTGAVGSVTGAVGSVTAGVTVSTNNDKTAYALTAGERTAIADAIRARQLTEGYAADGVAPTLEQAVFMLLQEIGEFSIAGVTITTKKLDKATTAMTHTLDSAVTPTSRTRTT